MNEQLTVPKCFNDPKDYVVWLQFDRASANNASTVGFVCKDCTPSHKEEMMRQGRCEHPEVVFGEYRRGDFGGYLPSIKEEPEEVEPTNYRTMVACNGEEHSINEWARIRGMKFQTLYSRLTKFMWTPEEALGFVERHHGKVRGRQHETVCS